MSIVDKLTYLQTTKQLLKTEINKINNVLDDNSTFRSYPQELFNGYLDILNNGTDTLWNNLEKVSASGEEATLENVETAPIKMVLNGNTSQETTSGKNLLGLTNGTYSHNGITAVVNDGTITITGTATANSFVNIPLLKNIVLSDEQVTISANNATTISDSATEFRVYESGNNYMPVDFTSINSKRTYTKTGTYVSAYVRTTSGVSYGSGLVIKPQLEYGSTATSWEKYTGGQPSPSPDYPQEVKVVKGENVVSVQGKNLINQAELLSSLTYNSATGYYEGTPSSQFKQEIRLNFKENTSYTFRCEAYQDASSGDALQFYVYYKNGTNSHINLANTTRSTIFKITSTASQTIDYLELKYIRARNIHIKDMCLVEGNDISYVPYSKTDYPISLGTIELCKINTYKDYFHKDNGKWYVHKEIGKVVLDGSENFGVLTAWNYENTSVYHCGIQNVTNNSVLISNYFTYDANTYGKDINGIMQIVWGTNVLFRINNSIAPTVEDFKTWLSTHNTIVYYVLATPTEEEITDTSLIAQLEAIYKAKSVKDKTYITQTNDELPFILDVEAIKEYEVN